MKNVHLHPLDVLSKMKKEDWMFVASYFVLLFPIALFFDIVLNLIRGQYMIVSGLMICAYLVYNRISLREQTSLSAE